MTPTQKKHVRAWVEALRTGGYRKTRGVLKSRGCYCCLGVACEVYKASTGKGGWRRGLFGALEFDGEDKTLPLSVSGWLGLEEYDPLLAGAHEGDDLVSATCANDTKRWTFRKIADAIEARYLTPTPSASSRAKP